MVKIMKKLLTILLLASLSFTFTSCESWLDVNKNTDAPDQVDADLYLAGVLASLARGVNEDAQGPAMLTQMFGSTTKTAYAQHFYSKASDNQAEMWRVTYWLNGMNLENLINQALEAENWKLAGIGYAVKAYSWDILTKLHGELPMKEAFQPGLLSHKYDYQDEIYPQVREWAEKAIELLEMEDVTDYSMTTLKESDLIYGGDAQKWIKFAHGVIAKNLASLTRKNNFLSDYADDLIYHANLSLQSNDDNAQVEKSGEGASAQFGEYNNRWGVYYGTMSDYRFASDFAVQVMTGTLVMYDKATGNRIDAEPDTAGNVSKIYPFALSPIQYVADTSKAPGHFDPRVTAKIGTRDARFYQNMDNVDSIKSWIYYGGSLTGWSGPIGSAANLWGTRTSATSNGANDGQGRWLYRNNAPYIVMTAAEMQFYLAETYWYKGDKASALAALKKGIALDVEFTGLHLSPGAPQVSSTDKDGNVTYKQGGALPGGDVVTKAAYNTLAAEYIAGPYCNGLTEDQLTLSHIMLQKFVGMYAWGAIEVWTDFRKYHYDLDFAGEVPTFGDGYDLTTVTQKWDDDDTKVYKGYYLAPAQVEYRRSKWNAENNGSPCYRFRPRYNSEYMWNSNSLDELKPISGNALNYQCSIPWFAYPGDMPKN